MFLSIIIPIYNDEKYIEECLDSCLSQDLPLEEYEIICVDDGSTDQTPKILSEYSKKYSNIVPIYKKHGVQYGNGRNIGLEHANGNYVWFVDHDDFVEANVLAALCEIAHETTCDRIAFDAYEFTDALTDEEAGLRKSGKLKSNAILLRDSVVWTSIIKRDYLLSHDIWPRSKRFEDKPYWSTDTFFLYELRRSGIQTEMYKGKPCYFYRRHATAETMTTAPEVLQKKIDGKINVARLIKEDYDKEICKNGKASEITAFQRVAWVRMCLFSIVPASRDVYKESIHKMRTYGLIPIPIPKESNYSLKQCMKENSSMGRFRSFGFYYSPTTFGLILYRLSFLKMFIVREIRKSKFIKAINKAREMTYNR